MMTTILIILAIPTIIALIGAVIGLALAGDHRGTYAINLLISLDQRINTLCGGAPDETISAACYRFGGRIPPKSALWWCAYKGVNLLFFWQPDHCRMAYQSELERKHLPPDLKNSEQNSGAV